MEQPGQGYALDPAEFDRLKVTLKGASDAHEAAKRAAETLDFSMADLVQELDNALQLKQRVTAAPEAAPARERDSGRRPDDDDSFENRSHLR